MQLTPQGPRNGRWVWVALSGAMLATAGLGATALTATGCKGTPTLIEKATLKVSDDLLKVRVALVFSQKIQAAYTGSFDVKQYGSLFITGATASTPMEVGFELNTAVVNDQDYLSLTPTTFLPNGNPIGIPHPVVEVRGTKPISSQFDLFGYVDVLKAQWLGAAAMFSFLTNDYFPPGLSVSQSFMTNPQGSPGVLASVFGPTLNPDGTLAKAGGIALFANVKQLLGQAVRGEIPTGRDIDLQAVPGIKLDGPGVASLPQEPEKLYPALRKWERKLIRGFNGQGL